MSWKEAISKKFFCSHSCPFLYIYRDDVVGRGNLYEICLVLRKNVTQNKLAKPCKEAGII